MKKQGDIAEYLTPEELNRIESVVVGDIFYSTFYKILRYSGRRLGEIVGTERSKGKLTGGIRLKDIDLEKQTMKTIILKTKKRKLQIKCDNCKTDNTYKNKFCNNCGVLLPEFNKENLNYDVPEERVIPMRPELPTILQTYINKHKPAFGNNSYIFREYSLPWLKKQIKVHCKQASITKNFTLHGYRRCFVTNCRKAGMTNGEIMLWTGHKNESSLNPYNSMVPDDVREKISQIKL